MSVILKDGRGRVLLLTKGADDVVIGRSNANDE